MQLSVDVYETERTVRTTYHPGSFLYRLSNGTKYRSRWCHSDVAPFNSEVGRLCPRCGSADIKMWDMHTCPKCGGELRIYWRKDFGLEDITIHSYMHQYLPVPEN